MLWIWACTGPAPSEAALDALRACETSACRLESVGPAWSADPEQVSVWLDALDEFEEAALVDVLAHRFPQEGAQLCAELGAGTAGRARCEKRFIRPHLSTRQVKQAVGVVSPLGPRSSDLPVLEPTAPPWAHATDDERAAAVGGCTDAACASARARDLGSTGDARSASLACAAASDEGQARSECLFQASEGLAEAGAVTEALRLCAHAGNFGPMCAAHGLQLGGPAPADGPEAATAHAALLEGLGDIGTVYADWFWASWTWSAVHAGTPASRLATDLPEVALPHVRAAAAWQVVARRTGSLDATVQLVARHLELPDTAPYSGQQVRTHTLRPGWSARPAEDSLPTVFLYGPSRRALAEDPDEDLTVAVLEAAWQQRTPPTAAWFLDGLSHERSRLVRWTAARILSELDPAAIDGLVDDDPVVAGRLAEHRRPAP